MADSFSNQPLHELIAYFRQRIQNRENLQWADSKSPIQALVTGNGDMAKQYAKDLEQVGIQVKPIAHPTVPRGMERLRICLHTFNTQQQIDLLFETLYK